MRATCSIKSQKDRSTNFLTDGFPWAPLTNLSTALFLKAANLSKESSWLHPLLQFLFQKLVATILQEVSSNCLLRRDHLVERKTLAELFHQGRQHLFSTWRIKKQAACTLAKMTLCLKVNYLSITIAISKMKTFTTRHLAKPMELP